MIIGVTGLSKLSSNKYNGYSISYYTRTPNFSIVVPVVKKNPTNQEKANVPLTTQHHQFTYRMRKIAINFTSAAGAFQLKFTVPLVNIGVLQTSGAIGPSKFNFEEMIFF